MPMTISSIAINCPPAPGAQPATGLFTASVETVDGVPVITLSRDGAVLLDFRLFEAPAPQQ